MKPITMRARMGAPVAVAIAALLCCGAASMPAAAMADEDAPSQQSSQDQTEPVIEKDADGTVSWDPDTLLSVEGENVFITADGELVDEGADTADTQDEADDSESGSANAEIDAQSIEVVDDEAGIEALSNGTKVDIPTKHDHPYMRCQTCGFECPIEEARTTFKSHTINTGHECTYSGDHRNEDDCNIKCTTCNWMSDYAKAKGEDGSAEKKAHTAETGHTSFVNWVCGHSEFKIVVHKNCTKNDVDTGVDHNKCYYRCSTCGEKFSNGDGKGNQRLREHCTSTGHTTNWTFYCESDKGSTIYDTGDEAVTMYRLYNRYTGEHFYTSSEQERDSLRWNGWSYEGTGWTAPKKSSIPVYRLYNPYVEGGDHHYTTSKVEYESLQKQGWTGEGIGWYSAESGSVKLYRQYNPYATTGTHNYTSSEVEKDNLVSSGWNDEDVAWYGLKWVEDKAAYTKEVNYILWPIRYVESQQHIGLSCKYCDSGFMGMNASGDWTDHEHTAHNDNFYQCLKCGLTWPRKNADGSFNWEAQAHINATGHRIRIPSWTVFYGQRPNRLSDNGVNGVFKDEDTRTVHIEAVGHWE